VTDLPPGATGTAKLVLEPQVRTFSEHRWLYGALSIPLLGLVAYAAVSRLSSLEEMLVANAAHASRIVLYDLPGSGTLAAPIEPGTQIIRLAMHAYRRNGELPVGKLEAHLEVTEQGTQGRRVEEVVVDVPGQRTRVTSDEAGLAIGDPIAVDFDVHDLGAGDLTVKVTKLDRADGLLVRMYRREELSPAKATARDAVLDRSRKNHIARWTWEPAWDEVSASEQEEILKGRWRRVGALRGAGHDLRSLAVAVAPRPPESEAAPHHDDRIGTTTLRGDERLGLILHEHAAVRVTSDQQTTLKASIRGLDGVVRTSQAKGELTVSSPDTGDESVEIGADADVLVEVRSPDPSGIEGFGHAQAWRAGAELPVVVESPETDRLLYVTLRRPVDRAETNAATVGANVDVTAPSLPTAIHRAMGAERTRSRFDRYDLLDPTEAPTERLSFYLAIPRGGRATITPTSPGELDVSLAELDDSKGPEPLVGRPASDPPPPVEREGEILWGGFVARRPSNAEAFNTERRPLLRIGRHFVLRDAPAAAPALARFTAPADRTDQGGLSFGKIGAPFRAAIGEPRPVFVPLRLLGDAGAKLDLTLTPAHASKTARAGVFDRVTLPRTIVLGPGATRATLIVGDDMPPGPVALTVTPHHDPGAPETASLPGSPLIHLPWVSRHSSAAPRWIAGQFEE
jgi:hypothetical protein